MRVFVAAATGTVGTRLLPLLASAGHSVLRLTRTPDKADLIRRRRRPAEAVVADCIWMERPSATQCWRPNRQTL